MPAKLLTELSADPTGNNMKHIPFRVKHEQRNIKACVSKERTEEKKTRVSKEILMSSNACHCSSYHFYFSHLLSFTPFWRSTPPLISLFFSFPFTCIFLPCHYFLCNSLFLLFIISPPTANRLGPLSIFNS